MITNIATAFPRKNTYEGKLNPSFFVIARKFIKPTFYPNIYTPRIYIFDT